MPATPSKISARMHHAPPRAAASGDALPSTTTFLFTDIEGSTRQWEQLPDMHDRVERHFAVLRRHVGELGGIVFSTMGDGIAASFPSAEGALHAAVGAQMELPRLGTQRPHGNPHRRGRTCRSRLPRPDDQPRRSDHGERTRRPDTAVERDCRDRDHRAEPGRTSSIAAPTTPGLRRTGAHLAGRPPGIANRVGAPGRPAGSLEQSSDPAHLTGRTGLSGRARR